MGNHGTVGYLLTLSHWISWRVEGDSVVDGGVKVQTPDESTKAEDSPPNGRETRVERVLAAFRQTPSGVTKSELRKSLAMSGGNLGTILEELIADRRVVACKVERKVKNRSRKVDGLRLPCGGGESHAAAEPGKLDGQTGPHKGPASPVQYPPARTQAAS